MINQRSHHCWGIVSKLIFILNSSRPCLLSYPSSFTVYFHRSDLVTPTRLSFLYYSTSFSVSSSSSSTFSVSSFSSSHFSASSLYLLCIFFLFLTLLSFFSVSSLYLLPLPPSSQLLLRVLLSLHLCSAFVLYSQ